MHRAAVTRVVIGGVVLMLAGPPAARAQDEAEFWAVKGVRADDVLHMRDVPNAESKSLAQIPSNARGLKNLGCRKSILSLDDWAKMTKEERARAETRWCRVEWHGQQGWVAWRYLEKDTGGAR